MSRRKTKDDDITKIPAFRKALKQAKAAAEIVDPLETLIRLLMIECPDASAKEILDMAVKLTKAMNGDPVAVVAALRSGIIRLVEEGV